MEPDDTKSIVAGAAGELRAQARAWAAKFKAGKPTTQDLAELRDWCARSPAHGLAWSRAAHDSRTLDEAMRVFVAVQAGRAPRPAGFLTRRRWMLGAAAGSALGAVVVAGMVRPPLGLWPSWEELGADYRTGTGEQRELTLAAQVQVMLNTQTSIAVQGEEGLPRVTLIRGEAAISAPTACEVVAGAGSLRLEQADVEIRRLADDRVRVRCQQGRAELRHPAGMVAIAAGQEVLYDDRRVGQPAPLRQPESSWRQGMVVFDGLPLRQVVQEINRYRPGRVVLLDDGLAERRFTARVRITDLEEALNLLEAAYHLRMRRMGDVVLIG